MVPRVSTSTLSMSSLYRRCDNTSLAFNGTSSSVMRRGGRRLREKDWQSSTLWSVLSRGAVGSLYWFTFVSG